MKATLKLSSSDRGFQVLENRIDDPVGETLSNAVIKCYLLFSIVQLASRAALST